MRIAAVSDIHGNLPALEAVWAEIERAGADLVVNLGDIASGPLWPKETVRWLIARERAEPERWRTIAGNHERQVLAPDIAAMGASDAHAARAMGSEERAWLGALPKALWIADDVLLCHGTPASDLHYFLETVEPGWTRGGFAGVRRASSQEVGERAAQLAPTPDQPVRSALAATLVFCGHTHLPRMMTVPKGPLIVNPGSVGLQAYDDDHPLPHVAESGSPHARWALVERTGGGPWRVELRATPYAWHAAAAQAASNGRGDWADAILTGFMGRFEAGGPVPGLRT
jgi:predicted phosphodiesterase